APQERRRFTRLPFALPASRLRGADLVEHQTLDVSAAGCALTSRELLPPGSRVSLVLRDPENAVRAYVEAEVIRTQSTEDGRAYVAGLALVNPGGADWRALLLYLMMCRDGRRLAPRLSLRSQALWAPRGRAGGKPIELRDLSVGGAQVSGPEVPETGDEGDVTFVNVEDGAYVHVPSRAVWTRHTASEDRAGLSFEPDGGAQARVARAVSAFVFSPLRVSPPNPASSQFMVGSFEVLEPLARGSTYQVYRGRGIGGPFQGREVALKRLDPRGAARPELVERFLAEADLGRILPSQFIATVLTAFAVGDERWMAAEWVEGTTLAALLEDWGAAGRLPPVRGVLDIFAQVLAGLGEAHEFRGGVSHGHLDASQILLAPGGQVKLIGFLGDPRRALASDVFQAAALLYRALGGRPPFEANSAEHYAALVRAGPRPLRMLNADVPESVEALVHRALRYELERRPTSASAFARALAVARQEN
ncbi:MAG TPA: PilZ domain-containing protein, partial [Myxococcaceae bacterium]|nr:PilZ domain-containing protein [Myxococcaceae bacterium]